jgi:DNA-binding Xre family transcriptional regulator
MIRAPIVKTNLAKLLWDRALTAKELASILNLSVKHIYELKSGRKGMSVETLEKLQKNFPGTEGQATKKVKTLFPGKISGSFSFNLTQTGRETLTSLGKSLKLSNGDVVETLIRKYENTPLPKLEKTSGPKGGAKSIFFGKNRGTTTAVGVTPEAAAICNFQANKAKLSRGDYMELLIRLEAGIL